MLEIVRDAPLGQAIRWVSNYRLLKYPEESPNFLLPLQYRHLLSEGKTSTPPHMPSPVAEEKPETTNTPNDSVTSSDNGSDLQPLQQVNTVTSIRTMPYSNERMQMEKTLDSFISAPIVPQKTSDGIILVDWYTTDDPANPQNWSPIKRYFVVFVLCFYTWTVYCAGPIYAASAPGIVEKFSVSPVAATLGLSLYVLAYGVGDLLFSPLTEIPIVGRNPVYCE